MNDNDLNFDKFVVLINNQKVGIVNICKDSYSMDDVMKMARKFLPSDAIACRENWIIGSIREIRFKDLRFAD